VTTSFFVAATLSLPQRLTKGVLYQLSYISSKTSFNHVSRSHRVTSSFFVAATLSLPQRLTKGALYQLSYISSKLFNRVSSKLLLRPDRRESAQPENAGPFSLQTRPKQSTSRTEHRPGHFLQVTGHPPSLPKSAWLEPRKSRVPHKNACAFAFTTRAQKQSGAQGRIRTSVAPKSGRFTVCYH
jgi:hypothetical protein